MTKGLSKFFSVLLVICMIVSMIPAAVFAASTPSVLYLKPNTEWLSDGARFAAYLFGNGDTWVSMTDSDGDGYYEAAIPSGYPSVIFCRMNGGSTENNWDNKWNQTGDLAIPTDGKNCWVMNSGDWNGNGVWETRSTEVSYYLHGYINGADFYGSDYTFSNGSLKVTFAADSYVYVCTSSGTVYMPETYVTDTSATLYTTGSEKMFVPGGVEVTFTLKVNSNGTLTLSYSQAACKEHKYDNGICTVCGLVCSHSWSNGKCGTCGKECTHSWGSDGICRTCGVVCKHESHNTSGKCSACGNTVSHNWSNGKCSTCGTTCKHTSHNTSGLCTTCGKSVSHTLVNGTCSVCGYGCTHSWSSGKCSKCGMTCNHASHNTSGKCTTCSSTVSHSYSNGKCSVCGKVCAHSWNNGTCKTCGQVCSHTWNGKTCTTCGSVKDTGIKIHFVNTLGWNGVVAYPWIASGSTTTGISGWDWPGQVINRDADGYFTLELDYEPTSGKSLGVLFHDFNGNQTADVTFSYATLSANKELWVKPDTYTNSEGKYGCATSTTESGMVISPEINGNQVTFRYENNSAKAVYVAGSFNNWSSSANKMTKSNGVWSTTLNLAEGAHEYKFVVDGEWITDPLNGTIGGYDENNVVVVGGSAANNGKITVKFHFYREGTNAYKDWDIWFWCEGASGSGTLETVAGDKGRVATFVLDGSINTSLGYTVRKTDWSNSEFYDRFIDLSDVASGTVHFFLNSGSEFGSRILGNDVVMASKPTYANLDYDSGNVWVKTPLPVSGNPADAFTIVDAYGNASDIKITKVTMDNNGYSLSLSRKMTPAEAGTYRVKCGTLRTIETDGLFYSKKFAEDYTYYGNDLGATWSKNSTTFKVWAPTAINVQVLRYKSGNYGTDDKIETVNMKLGEKGVWSATVYGNLDGTYYTYFVQFADSSTEAPDPYANSSGANGDRSMVLNMDATDPEGWDTDVSPNQGMNYTDAIIYEMHVREMTIDSTSGVKDEWKGKFLGLTQTGTNYQGRATALEHLKELGITHVQLMPVYDFNSSSVDEYHLNDWQQYAWGYDPVNHNVPDGGYSTDPFNGEVRVNEFKQMVQALHSNGINVVMDVVYNHVASAGDFCYNKIVPYYFTRFWGEQDWSLVSNGSYCGNDFATERSMARNYIVDSLTYWVEEYHVDGFRFDYAGLIDTTTLYEAITTIQAKYPNVIFYGEGWNKDGSTAIEPGYVLANMNNASHTPGMGYYNDSFRNAIAGDNGNSWGFVSGDSGKADLIGNSFRASNYFSTNPTQTINYVSCHDNFSLMDKLCISRNGAYWSELVRMNNLSAAIYMMAQGVPMIYSGEEVLREKINEDGYRIDNAHGTNDYVNKIRWNDLVDKEYAQMTDDYYGGLIDFRKNHAALRCADGGDAWNYVTYHKINDHCIMFYINGYPNWECSDGIVIIYNANTSTQWINLGDYGIPWGYWQACVHGDQAGITPLWGVDVGGYGTGAVGVEGISATMLVLGDLVHEESVYNRQNAGCPHTTHNTSGLCTNCGKSVSHTYVNGKCKVCGLSEDVPETITIYVDNNSNAKSKAVSTNTIWDSVYIYAWSEAAGKTTEFTGAWPGSTMTLVGDGIYSYELPVGATKVIFSDGKGGQTDDLAVPAYNSGTLMYDLDAEKWVEPKLPEEDYYVAGSMNGWNCAADGYLMTQNGLAYTIDITLGAGEHQFKITDGTWDNAWPNDNYTLSLDAKSVVTITFNPTTKSINTSVKALEEACKHTSHNTNGICTKCGENVGHTYSGGTCTVCGKSMDYYLHGYINGADYTGSDYKFTNGSLTTTFAEGSYVYICDNDGVEYMTQAYVDGTTGTFYNASTGAAEKMLVPGGVEVTFTLTVNSDGSLTLRYVTGGQVTPDPVGSTYYLAGTMNGWNEKNADYLLQKNGNVYKISVALTAGDYEFKITDGTWDNAWPGQNYQLNVPADSNVTITFNPATGEITVDGIQDKPIEDSKDIKWQVTNGTNANSASTNLRVLTWVDNLEKYSSVTFNVTINGKTTKLECTTVYTAILASGVAIRNPANVFKNPDAKYFATYTLKNIPKSAFDTPIVVTVTWTDLQGNQTTSESKTIVISSDWT